MRVSMANFWLLYVFSSVWLILQVSGANQTNAYLWELSFWLLVLPLATVAKPNGAVQFFWQPHANRQRGRWTNGLYSWRFAWTNSRPNVGKKVRFKATFPKVYNISQHYLISSKIWWFMKKAFHFASFSPRNYILRLNSFILRLKPL